MTLILGSYYNSINYFEHLNNMYACLRPTPLTLKKIDPVNKKVKFFIILIYTNNAHYHLLVMNIHTWTFHHYKSAISMIMIIHSSWWWENDFLNNIWISYLLYVYLRNISICKPKRLNNSKNPKGLSWLISTRIYKNTILSMIGHVLSS